MATRIISFSGRKHSGKTHLAKLTEQYGYKTINFADGLKDICCHILKISREFLDANKETPMSFILNDASIKYISLKTDIPYNILKARIKQPFVSIRNLLQFIGTDIIREYNPDWHVINLKQIIENNPNTKYCVADTRFLNEKQMLEKYNAECYYIIRKNNTNDCTHISELSLDESIFKSCNVIYNDASISELNNKWKEIYEYKMSN